MQTSNVDIYEQTIQLIEKNISANPLMTRQNEPASFVYPGKNPELVLISSNDMKRLIESDQKNAIPIIDYISQNILGELKNELHMDNNLELMKIYEKFKRNILEYLMNIEEIMKKLSDFAISSFLTKYGNGLLNDITEFTKEFEILIAGRFENKEEINTRLLKIQEIMNFGVLDINKEYDLIIYKLESLMKKNKMAVKNYGIPKSFELVNQVNINNSKSIPLINGIDVHPFKNVYVAMGCSDGDLVIIDHDTNKEINRVKLHNNSGDGVQCCLWSPSGNKILVSTRINHSIYIYDDTGHKMLQSIEKTHLFDGCGAIWLSEDLVAVGYVDGTIKIFNISEGKTIKELKMKLIHIVGIECLDMFHLLVENKGGSISNLDWKNSKIEWVKTGWCLKDKNIACLRLNHDKTKLLTCGNDCFVKLMKLVDQSKQWEFKLDNTAVGASWTPNELYIIAISSRKLLIALNSYDGTKIIEFNEFFFSCRSLRINPRTGEIFIGDNTGSVRKLRIDHVKAEQINIYIKQQKVKSKFQILYIGDFIRLRKNILPE